MKSEPNINTLKDKILDLEQELNKLVLEYSLDSELIITKSRELDTTINNYYFVLNKCPGMHKQYSNSSLRRGVHYGNK